MCCEKTRPTFWLNTTMAYKSKYIPRYPAKYLGDATNVICRSTWERAFCKYCDETPGVLRWASEEFFIPYVSPVDGQIHRYFPDFMLEVQSNTGLKRFVIEVKPKYQTELPATQKRKTKRYLTEVATYAVNQAKWQAAKEFCQKQGMNFLVLTEEHLFKTFK